MGKLGKNIKFVRQMGCCVEKVVEGLLAISPIHRLNAVLRMI